MDSLQISLTTAILFTTIWAIVLLGISSLIGVALGWLCGQNAIVAAVSQRVLQLFTCWTVVCTASNFCLVCMIALFTTIGIQKAKQNMNRWEIAIAHSFLGIRFGLILFWVIIQTLPDLPGLGRYIYTAYSNSNLIGMLQGASCVLVLAILFDQALGLLERYLVNRALRSPRRAS
ncbi:MAG: hypothetical protein MUC48_21855 [Leptolyngbya sp. Prado105]|jgi:ABC-type nitrate/sulfonate/bicarbonate transport system permease component|nr:hypothetical protein [Leptolyngbya sp. Prado105]